MYHNGAPDTLLRKQMNVPVSGAQAADRNLPKSCDDDFSISGSLETGKQRIEKYSHRFKHRYEHSYQNNRVANEHTCPSNQTEGVKTIFGLGRKHITPQMQ